MKVYTKTGDGGETSLLGGMRVEKSNIRIESYGTVDELNSWMGLLRDQEVNKAIHEELINIQNNLFVIGSILATQPGKSLPKVPEIVIEDVTALEKAIDMMEESLPPMKFFVLPGGHPAVSYAHLARCVCRRAERRVIALSKEEEVEDLIIKYLNRLSDYLFVLSRKMGQSLEITEVPWVPRS